MLKHYKDQLYSCSEFQGNLKEFLLVHKYKLAGPDNTTYPKSEIFLVGILFYNCIYKLQQSSNRRELILKAGSRILNIHEVYGTIYFYFQLVIILDLWVSIKQQSSL